MTMTMNGELGFGEGWLSILGEHLPLLGIALLLLLKPQNYGALPMQGGR